MSGILPGGCVHTPKYPAPENVPSFEECMSHAVFVEDIPEVALQRALTSADGQTTRIDTSYWGTLNGVQRAAVIAHERAHPFLGMDVSCEGCADKVGGFFMRAWGYCPTVVRSTYASLKVERKPEHGKAPASAYEGARNAERGLAARGLLGTTSLATTSRLAAIRAQATSGTTTTAGAPVPAPVTSTDVTTAATRPTVPKPAAGATGVADTAPIVPQPTQPTEASATAVQVSPPGAPATTTAPDSGVSVEADVLDTLNAGVAGDVVSSVLGEEARPHTGKVLIGAGIAAIVAVVLVVLVRRS